MYKYNKTTWKNKEQDPKGGTPLSAANFNNMEEGIEQAHIKADRIETTGIGKKFLSDDGTYKFVSVGSGDSLTTASDDYVCFTATEDISTFTIQTTSDSTVTLLKENLEMVKDVDYTINKDTGVVSLNFILKKDEKIYYKVEEHISVSDMATVSDLYKHAESSEPHKNVIGTDTLTTSAKTVKEAINEVNNETINKIIISDSKPENMVKNTFYLENRDVVRDGLVEQLHNHQFDGTGNTKVIISNETLRDCVLNKKSFTFTFELIAGLANVSPLSLFSFAFSNFSGFQFGEGWTNNYKPTIRYCDKAYSFKGFPIIKNGSPIKIYVVSDGEKITIGVNDSIFILDITKDNISKENCTDIVLGGASGWYTTSLLKHMYLYNRALTAEEVKYNFHANAEDKISTIEDADGRKYAFSAKSQNVFMPNGSNLDAAMNQFISWKELQMNNDGTFPPTKCADWYNDKIYIEGQTVKNYLQLDDKIQVVGKESKHFTKYTVPENGKYKCMFWISGLSGFNTIELRLPYNYLYQLANIKNGLNVIDVEISNDETVGYGLYVRGAREDTSCIVNYMCLLDNSCSAVVLDSIPLGLTSLGDKKDGRTYISLESNGYENQIEIAEPLRNWDTLEDGIVVVGTGETVFSGTEEYIDAVLSDRLVKTVNLQIGKKGLKYNSLPICNLFNSNGWSLLDDEFVSIGASDHIHFRIFKAKLTAYGLIDGNVSTYVPSFKAWLKAQKDAGTPVTVQYQLATPRVEQVKSTFVYAPNQNGECSFKFNNAVAPSNSKLGVAQTTNQALDEIKTAIISLGGVL